MNTEAAATFPAAFAIYSMYIVKLAHLLPGCSRYLQLCLLDEIGAVGIRIDLSGGTLAVPSPCNLHPRFMRLRERQSAFHSHPSDRRVSIVLSAPGLARQCPHLTVPQTSPGYHIAKKLVRSGQL